MSVLTSGQAQIVSVASRGHNLLITGQAGTGKSTVVEEIISNLNAVSLKVAVVRSSGVACTVYEPVYGPLCTWNSATVLSLMYIAYQCFYLPTKISTVVNIQHFCLFLASWDQAKLWCNPYQLISSSSKASRIKELHAERKETVIEFDFPVFALSVTRLALHYKGASKCSRGVAGKE